jgi:hypothetical protein
MGRDKKVADGAARFVLLERLGHAVADAASTSPTSKRSSAPDPARGAAAIEPKKNGARGRRCRGWCNYWQVIFTALIWLPELMFSV